MYYVIGFNKIITKLYSTLVCKNSYIISIMRAADNAYEEEDREEEEEEE